MFSIRIRFLFRLRKFKIWAQHGFDTAKLIFFYYKVIANAGYLEQNYYYP